MKAVSAAGYRAIAPDMRGYGRSSAPVDATLYTPLYTAGDLVGLLDALTVSSAVLVGHDWGAAHAWNAALMRPDRFQAVFCLSVPYVPRGDVSNSQRRRESGDHKRIPPDDRRIGGVRAMGVVAVVSSANNLPLRSGIDKVRK